MVERESVMRSLNDRIYSTIYLRMRDTAPNTLKRLETAHVD